MGEGEKHGKQMRGASKRKQQRCFKDGNKDSKAKDRRMGDGRVDEGGGRGGVTEQSGKI